MVRWRRDVRPTAVQMATDATRSMPWTPRLLKTLFEELYVDDSVSSLLHVPLRRLEKRRYPEAIAVALIVRHSWRADDLAWILQRLGVLSKVRTGNKSVAGDRVPSNACRIAAGF